MTSTGVHFPTQAYFADAKGRLGFSIGNALFYCAAGFSFGQNENNSGIFAQTGFVSGVDADLMVTDKLFAGIEYLTREINGPGTPDPDFGYLRNIQSILLRAGGRF